VAARRVFANTRTALEAYLTLKMLSCICVGLGRDRSRGSNRLVRSFVSGCTVWISLLHRKFSMIGFFNLWPWPCVIEIEYVLRNGPQKRALIAMKTKSEGLMWQMTWSVRALSCIEPRMSLLSNNRLSLRIDCNACCAIKCCFYFCSTHMCNVCRIGEVVQSVGHGPSVCLLIGPHAW